MRVHQNTILDATDLTTTETSETFQLEHMYGYSIYILYTGNGVQMDTEVKLEVSNDGSSWFEYHSFNLTGLSDSCVVNATDVFYKTARVTLIVNTGSISTSFVVSM